MVPSRLRSLQPLLASCRCWQQRAHPQAFRSLTAGSLATRDAKASAVAGNAGALRGLSWTNVAGRSSAVPALPQASGTHRSLSQTSPSVTQGLHRHWLYAGRGRQRIADERTPVSALSAGPWGGTLLPHAVKHAEPVLVDQDKSKFYSPANLLEGLIPTDGLAGSAEFQLWKKDGFLHVKAVSMDFTLALPVFVSDGRGYPSLSAILKLWQACRSERWAALKQYLITSAGRKGTMRNEENHRVITLKHSGKKLDKQWETQAGTAGKIWVFTMQK